MADLDDAIRAWLNSVPRVDQWSGVVEINMPNVPLSREVIDLLVGDLPPIPPKQVATFTYAEDDRRECPECGAAVEAVQIVGDAAVSTGAGGASVSITSDAVACLPCGHEVRR